MDFEESLKNQYYFYHPNLEDYLDIQGALAFQLFKVLRLKPSSQIILSNGLGKKALYNIKELSKNSALLEKLEEKTEKPLFSLNLICALLKKDKNEWLLQKATELGIKQVCFFQGDYSVNRIETLQKKEERLLKITQEAMEQSKNAFLPQISFSSSLKEALKNFKIQNTFYADLHTENTLYSVAEQKKLEEINFIIGAEGGLSESEEKFLTEQNIQKVWLSPSILRAETAAVCALSQARLVCKNC